jgi:hypothetical protein
MPLTIVAGLQQPALDAGPGTALESACAFVNPIRRSSSATCLVLIGMAQTSSKAKMTSEP